MPKFKNIWGKGTYEGEKWSKENNAWSDITNPEVLDDKVLGYDEIENNSTNNLKIYFIDDVRGKTVFHRIGLNVLEGHKDFKNFNLNNPDNLLILSLNAREGYVEDENGIGKVITEEIEGNPRQDYVIIDSIDGNQSEPYSINKLIVNGRTKIDKVTIKDVLKEIVCNDVKDEDGYKVELVCYIIYDKEKNEISAIFEKNSENNTSTRAGVFLHVNKYYSHIENNSNLVVLAIVHTHPLAKLSKNRKQILGASCYDVNSALESRSPNYSIEISKNKKELFTFNVAVPYEIDKEKENYTKNIFNSIFSYTSVLDDPLILIQDILSRNLRGKVATNPYENLKINCPTE